MDNLTDSKSVASQDANSNPGDPDEIVVTDKEVREFIGGQSFEDYARSFLRTLKKVNRDAARYGQEHAGRTQHYMDQRLDRMPHEGPKNRLDGPPPDIAGLLDEDELAEIDPIQLLALQFIVGGYSYTRVAEAMKISRLTLYRWRRNCRPFRKLLVHYRRSAIEETLDGVAQLGERANTTLSDAMKEHDVNAAWRVIRQVHRMSRRSPARRPAAGANFKQPHAPK